jgi:tRNA dimethylallyltransferase
VYRVLPPALRSYFPGMPLVAVLAGPTASGKSALALRWAEARGLHILSADSRQLYRGFAIGTGAPTADDLRKVPHHLVGSVDPSEPFSPARFRAEARALVAAHPGANFLVVGGTGLYLKEWMRPSAERGETPPAIRAAAEEELRAKGPAAVHAELRALDPEAMEGIDPRDRHRVLKRLENWRATGRSYKAPESAPDPSFEGVPFLWLDPARDALHRSIEIRVKRMLAEGWGDEVQRLMRAHDPESTPAFNALGYRELARALRLGHAPETVLEVILARTRQYAKKQVTFFRHQFPGSRAFEPGVLAQKLESSGWNENSLSSND